MRFVPIRRVLKTLNGELWWPTTDTRGKPCVDDRRVISGIIHVIKSGGRWVDAPTVYGPRKTLYNRFQRWAAKGIWSSIFQALANAGGPLLAVES